MAVYGAASSDKPGLEFSDGSASASDSDDTLAIVSSIMTLKEHLAAY